MGRPLFEIQIQKSELVLETFLREKDKKTVRIALNEQKVPYKERSNRFYISLSVFGAARDALRQFGMTQRESYKAMMRRFAEQTPVVIDWYPSYCTVKGGIPIALFDKSMSYFDETNRQLTSYKKGYIDGVEHLFNAERGTFPSGLLDRAVEILRLQGTPFTVNRQFAIPEPTLKLNPVFDFVPTADQINAVDAMCAQTNGIGKLPTGFGKTSYVACAMIAKHRVKALFLANQRVLIDDAAEDFKRVFRNDSIHVGKIGDGMYDPGDVTVASIQGIIAALTPFTESERQQLESDKGRCETMLAHNPNDSSAKRGMTNVNKRIAAAEKRESRRLDLIRFLKEEVKMFIVDEAQVLGTSTWKTFLDVCPAAYRYGLTATDTRTNGGRIEIIAATGERRYQSSAAEQIEKGRLSEFRAEYLEFDHGMSDEDLKSLKMEYHEAYKYFIVENEERNNLLIDKTLQWAMEGKSILALVTQTDHGNRILAELERRNIPSHLYRFVHGQTSKKQRQDTIAAYRNGEFPILIGTSIFDVGFNAKIASRMVRFNAGASEVREPQRAGRTVRKRDDDSHGEMFDVIDLGCPFFKKQSLDRVRHISKEFGEDRVKIISRHKSLVKHPFIVEPVADEDRLMTPPDLKKETLPF